MIENRVGPPLSGIPEFAAPKEAARAPRGDKSGSFGKALDDSMRAPRGSPPPKVERPLRETKETEALAPPVEPRMTAREKAIQKFMDSIESEFGIQPTEIVGAMALLDPEKLAASPEATAVELVESFGLEEEDADQVLAMYGALLTELRIIDNQSMMRPLPPVTDALPQTGDFKQRHAFAHDRRMARNDSVDKLNQKFWMTGAGAARMPAEAPVVMAKDSGWAHSQMDPMMRAGFEDPMMDPVLPEGMDEALPVMRDGPALQPQPMDPRKMAQLEEALGPQPQKPSPMSAAGFMATAMPRSGQPVEASAPLTENAPALKALGSEFSAPVAPMETSSFETSAEDFQSGFGDGESSDSGGESASGGAHDSDIMSLKAAPQPLKLEDVAAALRTNAAPVAATATGAAMTADQTEASVKQIMNQAQYLIKKGGGEMKVQMTPEGMGQIQLKVLVQDGKVNVQMAAETSEAKKAIESSLPELRSSLAAHKLSMDHVKVDVVSGPSTDTASRNDMQSGADSGREGTRQFWNQFQEQFGNRSRNDGFWDVPHLKGYQRTNSRDPLQPMEGESRVASRKVEGKGSGLNLVA